MLADLVTMIRKEWKEVFLMRGSMRSGILNLIIILGLLGIFMPLQTGSDWLKSPLPVLVWCWVPVFTALAIITDAFAGERERHTLETLLASRLEDRAILFGKISAAVLYAWMITIMSMLMAAVTINIAYPQEGIQFYSAIFFLAVLAVSLLVALLFSCLGVLVSLNAQTARQAYQKLSAVMIVLWLIPMLGLQFLPDTFKQPVMQFLMRSDLNSVLGAAVALLLVINSALLILAQSRFKRARLILD